jgi:signal transduction histidine kinase/DNA-binding LacI/PurR family transcriptional regulator/AraC-like DNA-binding protein/DNA-binding LytR/AlgR family response regulator
MPATINVPEISKPDGDFLLKRPTFGFIVTWGLTNPYSSPMWWGAVKAAETLDVNLVGFGDINIYDLQRNRSLYSQIQPSTVDGLVLVNPTLPRLHREVFGPVPVVNIGLSTEDVVTSILVDNHEGMRTAVRHLIENHGRRRLAFIKGPANNPDSEERFRAYVEELQCHGLTVDPDLLYQPFDWSPIGGRDGARVFLDERGVQFDALVAANDNMALAAMAELQLRGLHVPYDVAVSGFDDAIESSTSTPPLTTVRQPLQKMGQLALEALVAYHQGKSVPPRLFLPTTLMMRRSCGCLSEAVVNVNQGMQIAKPEEKATEPTRMAHAGSLLEERREVLLGEMQRALVLQDLPVFSQMAGEWLEALIISLEKGDNGENFLTAIDLTSRRLTERQISVAELQDVLSALRREGCRALAEHPALLAQAENLWHRARVFLNELTLQQQNQKRIQLNDQMAVLRAISQTMAVTFHLDNLMEILVRDLKQLGIESCYVALYDGVNRPAEWARLVLACNEGRQLTLKGKRRYPVAQLLPADLWGERRRTLVLDALEFQSEEIGFVLFEVGPHDGAVYEALRSQLGSSIKGAVLFDERDHLLTKTTQLYRQAAAGQRLAEEANRLKSRFLSMVSHELRAPLNLITGLSELTLKDTDSKKPLNSDNLKLMHITAQHLDDLIRDVLDLARDEMGQLGLVCEPLDLAKVLEAVVVVGEQLAREHGLDWHAQIPADLPLVWGDPTRLRQVILNLINNAVKFTEKGAVSLLVMPGKELITISVVDTGLGILPAEQSVIFDEFRQSDRTTARGYGGLGLGLAICKRLVKMHGGEIAVRSSGVEGDGATFFFTLPTLQAVSLRGEATAAVWIITTQPKNAQPLKHYLDEQGFNAEIQFWDKNGHWLTRATQTPPAAMVLDVHKAGRRSLDAMRVLRANPATSEITVLFYTLQVEQDSGAMLELDYLTKPIGTSELAKALQRVGCVESSAAADEMATTCQTILIVDDDPGVLDMHAQIVRTKFPQHQILLATSGKEALQLLQTSHPDLVLLDLMMPEMDGFGVLEAMQKMETARQVPVIVLSAKTLTEEEMVRLNRSVAVVLRKGMFTSTETLTHIKDTLMHRQKLSSEAQRITRKAMAYVHEHYNESIGREDVARHVGVSEGYLSRCFTQETGLSLIHYVARYRIQQAKQFLNAGDMSITEIALEVGFSDSNYFSRAFHREVGISPLAYRRMQ